MPLSTRKHLKRVALFFFNICPNIASSLYSRCSEQQFTVKAKDSQDRRFWRSWRGLLLVASTVYLLLGSLRMLACGPILYYGPERFAWYLRHDPVFWSALYTIKLVNPLTAVCGPPFPLFLIYFDYLMSVKRFNYIWAPVYELIVLNGRHFLALNRLLLPQTILNASRPISSLRSVARFVQWFMASDRPVHPMVRFSVRHFTHCSPYLSTRTRLQAVALCAAGQAIVGLILFGLVTLMPPLGAAYVATLVAPAVQSVPGAVVLAIDCLLIYRCTVNLIATLLFLAHTFTVVQFVAHRHMQLMVGGLERRRKAWEKLSAKKKKSSVELSTAYSGYLTQLADEHCRLLVSIVHANRLIFSPLALFAACSNFLTNIYLLTATYQLEHLDRANRAANLTMAATQFGAFFLLLLPSLAHIRDLYRMSRPFAGAVAHFRVLPTDRLGRSSRSLLATKLKLAAYTEEVLITDDPVCYTIGPAWKITSYAFVEFIIFYTGNLLLVLQQLQSF